MKRALTAILLIGCSSAHTPSASNDDPLPANPECESGTIIGHCLTNMGTLCKGYPSDHKDECLQTGMVTGWFPGPCGNDDVSALSLSNGGCQDACGIISWSYPLGRKAPTDATRSAFKASCEAGGMTYVSTL